MLCFLPRIPVGIVHVHFSESRLNQLRAISVCWFGGILAFLCAMPGYAQSKTATTTLLTVTSGGSPTSSIAWGNAVTLTATVQAGVTPVTPGQVMFCDATAALCSDVHLLGLAQLTSSGTAVWRFRPPAGSHTYKAVFAGTNAYIASSSAAAPLTVNVGAGGYPSASIVSSSGAWGNYSLTATVQSFGDTNPLTGGITFEDTSQGNATLATATLGPSTPGLFWGPQAACGAGPGANAIAVADFNGDGYPDYAVVESVQGEVLIYVYQPILGCYKETASFTTTNSSPSGVVVADLNSDGIPDLVVPNSGLDTMEILLGHGDGTFSESTITTGAYTTKAVVGDFNGDGIPDLALCCSNDGITIHLGNGDGTFTKGSSTATNASTTSFIAGDFNGDGKLDLVVTVGGGIGVYLGNGDGTFAAGPTTAVSEPSNTDIWQLAAADFNGDGKLDLVLSTGVNVLPTAGKVAVLLGNGDGTFAAGTTLSTPDAPVQMIPADFNLDGVADLAVLDLGGAITVFVGNGDGTFAPGIHDPSLQPDFYQALAVADMDGDGRPDILYSGAYPPNYVIIYQGITKPMETASTGAIPIAPSGVGQHLVVAAYAGDATSIAETSDPVSLWGKPPATTTTLALTSNGQPATTISSGSALTLTATVMIGTSPMTSGQVNFCDATAAQCTDTHLIGSAQLTANGTATFKYVPGPGQYNYKAVFQVNGYGAASTSGVATLTVNPPAQTTVPTSTTIAESGSTSDYTLTATVVGTGATAAPSGSVSFLDTSYSNSVLASAALGPSTPGLAWTNAYTSSISDAGFIQIAAGDFNGDGITDIAELNTNSMSVTIYLGNGDGTFTTKAGPTLTGNAIAIVAGDFNHDGKVDLAVSWSTTSGSTNVGKLTIFLGNGDGTFTAAASAPAVGGSPSVFAAADFNGDGNLDLIVNDSTGTRILLGNGDGTFSQAPPTGVASTIAVGDLNGDGLPDLVVYATNVSAGGVYSEVLAVYLSNGDGTFRAAGPEMPFGGFRGPAVIGDFNGDGIPDIASIYGFYSPVYVFLGKGDGTFTAVPAASNAPTVNEPGGMVATDLNHDGKLDLVITNWNAYLGDSQIPDLTILLGNGDGTFTEIPGDTQLNQTWSIVAADFNGDGIPDVATGTSSGLSVLLTEPTETATATAIGVNPPGPAPHQVDASYPGDSNYKSSTSTTVPLAVQVASPVLSLAPGTYNSLQTLTITDATPGATIYYQASGTVQTSTWTAYTGPITLENPGSVSFSVYATETGYEDSATVNATYLLQLPPAPAPVLSPAGGSYAGPQTVTITDAATGAPIYYTTNGSMPTNQATLYTGPITVSTSETVAAVADGGGYSQGPVASSQYFIDSAASSFVYTFAGTAYRGYAGDGGPATAAMLNAPQATVFDNAGNLYIADSGNNVVRRVDAKTGLITTVAGTGISGYTGDNGPATSAELNYPSGLAFDGAGNLYISDLINGVVRKVAAGTGTITTYAGNSTATSVGDNGPATSAQILEPAGLAFDANGDLYIGSGFRVRKVATATGTITTVAGNGSYGYTGDGGPATSAALSYQVGSIVFDSKGDMFFADTGNDAIREVAASTGTITTVAGKGPAYSGSLYSGDGGPATSAQLNYPNGIVLDSAGDLYIADTSNSVIREVTASNGIIHTIVPACSALSGDGGPATSSGVCNPYDLKFDATGNLYVAEGGENRIRLVMPPTLPPAKATPAPVFAAPAGTYNSPQQVTITSAAPGAEIYVTLDGSTPKTTGGEYHGPIPVTGSVTLTAVAVAPGYLASAPVAASYTTTSPPSAVISTVAGTGVAGVPQPGTQAISSPIGWIESVAVDASGNVYLPDPGNAVVWMIAANSGNMQVIAGTLGSSGEGGNGGLATSAQLIFPTHVAVDSQGNLYIADLAANEIRKVTAATGVISLYAGSGAYYGPIGDGGPATSARLENPMGMTVDSAGNLYIADSYDGRIRMVNAAGIITTVAGTGTYGPLGDGEPAVSATLSLPVDVALDGQGNLYIADSGDARVREVIAATGNISTVAGDGNSGISGDGGAAIQAELYPLSIALDASGNLYIADSYTSVRMVDAASGEISRVAGSGFGGFNGDGISATMADLCDPQGVALDHIGSLYIADSCDYRIRKVSFLHSTPAPVFSLAAGTYQSSQTLTITDSAPGANIFYTTDGSTPTSTSTAYTGAIAVASTETVQAIAVAPGFTASAVTSATYTINPPATPTITWAAPAAITYGTALSSTQLNATASVPGTFVYSPALGTVLSAGRQTLTATFTPTDATDYTPATASVTLMVNPAVPVITWATPAPINYGTALGSSQLNATASVPGTFAYLPASGTVLGAGSHTLQVTFTPTDSTDYANASASVTLSVRETAPTLAWAAPAAITYGTALSSTQLSATASVPGTFAYSPALGAVLSAGSQTLTATFTPTDTADYTTATATVTLMVNQAKPVITWPAPVAVNFGTALSSAQLDATASVPGAFAYSPAAGTVLPAGSDTLSVTFTPADATDYTTATASVTLVVNPFNPTPGVSSLSPAIASAGGSSFTLTVGGSAFQSTSTIYWGTTALTTRLVSATQLTAQVPAADIASAGTASITVQTPAPGGGTSNAMVFEVDSAQSGSSPTFATVSATVAPGASASYPVTLPSSATNVSASCLNLPTGAACSYSAATGAVTISTSSTTPPGTYPITVVFTETLPGVADAGFLLPFLVLPFLYFRKRFARNGWLTAGMALVLAVAAIHATGCGGGGSSTPPPPQTHQVTSSGIVTLTVQ